jgi:hypothetical protein
MVVSPRSSAGRSIQPNGCRQLSIKSAQAPFRVLFNCQQPFLMSSHLGILNKKDIEITGITIRFTRVLGVASLACLLVGTAAQAQDKAGWVSLFEGKTLEGWRASENPKSFRAVDSSFLFLFSVTVPLAEPRQLSTGQPSPDVYALAPAKNSFQQAGPEVQLTLSGVAAVGGTSRLNRRASQTFGHVSKSLVVPVVLKSK